MIGAISGAYDEMGWNDAEQPGHLNRAATSGLLLVMSGVYWGSVWMLSGLAPFAYLAARANGDRPADQRPRRDRVR